MATVLTEPAGVATEEMVHVSIPILKWEQDEDGDLVVKGIATDGTVDSDSQIVDPAWSADALSKWLNTGGNVRMSHDPHRPVGKGLRVDVNKDNSGQHWVTTVVVDPLAQKLVKKGVLTAYSVGISHPVIKHDPTGRARGGIITGGELAELSLVDRPSNKSSYLELAKSAADGTCEFTGKMVGGDLLDKADASVLKDISAFDATSELAGLNLTFTPNDMAELVMKKVRDKVISDHYSELARSAEKRDFDRGVGGGVDRDKLPDSDFAGPHRSFPIVNQSDVSDALHLAGHADDPAAVRANIKRIARSKGLSVPDDTDEKKEDVPEIVKDPPMGAEGDAASASPGKKLSSPECLDADGDCDGDGVGMLGDAASAKAAMPKPKGKPKAGMPKPKPGKGKKKMPPWLNQGDGQAEKCDTKDPKTAGMVEEAPPVDKAPLGMLQESPAPSHMKSDAVALRYKTVGIDFDMGALHDMTCPAYSPEDVASYHPFADFRTLIDENMWQRKALTAATGPSIEKAMEAQKAWQAAAILKSADPADLNAYRRDLHKAFRDANPGPTSYPTPGTVSAQRYNRPCITDGHSANGSGYDSPNSSAMVASSAPNAHGFSRPPLSSGHQTPSPSFMKTSWPYPEQNGVLSTLDYPEMEREKARRALSMMHDHLIHMFPSVCPIVDQDAYRVENSPTTALPSIAGMGKAIEPEAQAEVLSDVYKYIKKLEKRVRAGEITEDQARTMLSKRTAENYAKKLAKDVQKGMTSIDEVAKALGIERPEPVREIKADAPALGMTLKGMTPDVMKTMMSEILEPLQQQIAAQHQQLLDYQQQITENQGLLKDQQARIDDYDKRWDALANTVNPASAPLIPGLAHKTAGPAAIAKQAQLSEHVQGMMMRQLERTWRTSENPAEREAAYSALNKMKSTIE